MGGAGNIVQWDNIYETEFNIIDRRKGGREARRQEGWVPRWSGGSTVVGPSQRGGAWLAVGLCGGTARRWLLG